MKFRRFTGHRAEINARLAQQVSTARGVGSQNKGRQFHAFSNRRCSLQPGARRKNTPCSLMAESTHHKLTLFGAFSKWLPPGHDKLRPTDSFLKVFSISISPRPNPSVVESIRCLNREWRKAVLEVPAAGLKKEHEQ